MSKKLICLLARYAIAQHLHKWQKCLHLTIAPVVQLTTSPSGIDCNSTLFLDPISFYLLKLSANQLYQVTFCRQDEEVQQLLSVRPTTNFANPHAQLSALSVFELFGETHCISTICITKFIPHMFAVPTANEVWLDPIRTDQSFCSDQEDIDNELVDYFQTPRLLCSNSVVMIESVGIAHKSTFYFVVNLKESPRWVDETTKIFQSCTLSSRYPRQKVHLKRTFVPSGVWKLANNAKHVLGDFFKTNANCSSMIVFILAGDAGFGKDLCLELIADFLCVNRLVFDCYDLWSVEGKSTEGVLNSWMDKVSNLQPCICELKNLNALNGNPAIDLELGSKMLNSLSSCIQTFSGCAALFITTSISELSTLPKNVTKLAHFEYVCEDLDEHDRVLFAEFVQRNYATTVNVKWLTDSTRGLVLSELNQLLNEAVVHASQNDRHQLQLVDFEWALEQRNREFGQSIGVPEIPTVTWDDVGGLDDVKQLISESLKANLNPNRLPNMRRSGVVLWGAPGCGKTLIAKAVANEFKMTFLSVKGPELLNQYIGQSEQNLRHVFEKARLASPSIIFFDELDSLAPNRGVAGDSNGVMDRMVSQLLSELDDLQTKKNCTVFVIGATNRPDLLDKCLLSPGRFDKLIEVKMATDVDSKVRILNPICKKVNLAKDLSVLAIAQQCPEKMSGAELSALVSGAAMHAIRSIILSLKPGEKPPSTVRIEREHIQCALGSMFSPNQG